MKLLSFLFAIAISFNALAGEVYTVIANPGENASKSVQLNWHTDTDADPTYCFYTECSDIHWARARKAVPQQHLCTAFDSM